MRLKHDSTWDAYLEYRKSIGDPHIVRGGGGGGSSSGGKSGKGKSGVRVLEKKGESSSDIEMRESRKTLNKKMLQQFRNLTQKGDGRGSGGIQTTVLMWYNSLL